MRRQQIARRLQRVRHVRADAVVFERGGDDRGHLRIALAHQHACEGGIRSGNVFLPFGQVDPEIGAGTGIAVETDAAAVAFDNAFGNAQAEARCRLFWRASEASAWANFSKNLFAKFVGNAGPVVVYDQAQRIAVVGDIQRHRAARRRKSPRWRSDW